MDLLESESESNWDEVACLEPCSGPQGPQCSGLFGTAQGEWPVWDSLESDSEISVISLCSEECRLASSELRLDGRFCRFCDCSKGRHYREFFDALLLWKGVTIANFVMHLLLWKGVTIANFLMHFLLWKGVTIANFVMHFLLWVSLPRIF